MHHVHASRLRSTFMIILARHTQRTHITHTYQNHTPHAYSNTRRRITHTHYADASCSRITFTNRFHASSSSIALTLHVHVEPARHTLTTHAHYKRVPKAPHTTRIFANTRRRITFTHRVHASRSCITFTHLVQALRLHSMFMIKFASHAQSQRMAITQAYQKFDTPLAYSHTHAVESRSRITQRVHASLSRIALTLYVHGK
jgi:hypothetical protein